MSRQDDDFWMDDPEWAALREKQKFNKSKSKLSRAQRKKLREAEFQAELKAQEAKAAQAQAAAMPSPAARAYMDTGRPSARYGAQPPRIMTPTSEATSSPANPNSPTTSTGEKNVNVSLNITLPKVDITKVKHRAKAKVARITPVPVKKQLKKLTHKQLMIGAAGTAVLVIGLLGTFALIAHKHSGQGSGKGVLAEQTIKVDFKPLLPNGKTDETTAHKAAIDGQGRPIYTFIDKIGNTDLTVSEQPLPESFKANPDTELDKMAKDLYLTEVINQSNPKAYLGTSVKGPQTVIFVKNGLLVFIQSQAKIDKDQWSDYVTRLIQ